MKIPYKILQSNFFKQKYLLYFTSVVIIPLLIYYFTTRSVEVFEYILKPNSVPIEIMGTGTLEARLKSVVSSKISGRIQHISVDQGDVVRKGQLLFKLEDDDLKQQVEIADANLEFLQASVTKLDAEMKQAQAINDHAKSSYQRSKNLFATKSISVQEYEDALEKFKVAEYGLSHATAALLESRKQIVSAESALGYSKAKLADSLVSAPFDGVIIKRMKDPGDISVPGSAILTIASTKELWISAWIDETVVSKIDLLQPARIIFRSEANNSFEGQITRIGQETDRETREFVVDVTALRMPAKWALGQRAEVYIQVNKYKDSLIIPRKFLHIVNGRQGVFLKDSSNAKWHSPKLEMITSEHALVLDGLKEGEILLEPVNSQEHLRDGIKIELR